MSQLLSVIVPVYNVIDYLEKCVTSILSQSYTELELLLVDDGSTDGSGELCDRLAKKDDRIKVIHKKNGGSSSARNEGIRQAKGEWLAFVDSDDFIESDMYERLMQVLMAHNGKIAQIGRNEIDEQGNLMADVCIPPKELEAIDSKSFLRELLLHRGDCSFCTKVLHRDVFRTKSGEERLFPEGVLNEDFYLIIQMLSDVEKIYSLPGYGYHVFYRIGSNTRKKDKEQFSRVFIDIVNNADVVYDRVLCDFPELKEEAIRFNLFQRLDYLLHIPISQMTRENGMYRDIIRYLRRHRVDVVKNAYLTKKNRCYLLLFSIAPKALRKLHRLTMRLRGIE